MRKYSLLLALSMLTASCNTRQGDYNPVATIKDIMDSEVDPAADYIWESVQVEVSAAGTVERQPRNDEEWKEERRRAVILVEAANLLLMPGRRVAKPGEKAENPQVELDPEEIEALIARDRDSFVKLAREFQDTAIEQLKAVDEKNVPEILRIGGDLDARCETCHKKYWYPNDPSFKEEQADSKKQ